MEKILITGSSGYVGYVLAKYFSEKNKIVIGLDVHDNPVWKGNSRFKFYNCDITDKKTIQSIFDKEKPTIVIHLAYLMNPLHDVKREYDIDVNGSKYIIQIANNTKTVKEFIQFSSASAYGAWPNNKLWIKESQELKPRNYRYGINKKIVEEYYNSFDRRKDLRLVTLRMCTAIGPLYHKKGGVVSLLVNSPLLMKFNNRHCEIQFIHETDLTNLIELIINDSKIKGTFNLAPDSYATTKELALKKLFLPMPLFLMKFIIKILWVLRLSSSRPPAITIATYGIIVDPKKLMNRYNYKFKFSTKSGFFDTVKKRKEAGIL